MKAVLRASDAAAGDGRQWPQSVRITRRERLLLNEAARNGRTTVAGILRMGLDPLFARLATRFGEDMAEPAIQ